MKKIIFLGLGSIAKKHINVLFDNHKNFKLYALRSSKKSINYDGVINLYDIDDLKKIKFYFSIISSPTYLRNEHLKIINELNIPIFVEKPICHDKKSFKKINQINFRNKINYVACNLRFLNTIKFIKDYLYNNNINVNEVNSYCGSFLPEWRSIEDYTNSYSISKQLGGGVHLDLIHEPDYLSYIFGYPQSVIKSYNKVSDIIGDSFDSASIIFLYEKFTISIRLNYYRRDSKRFFEIVHNDGTLYIDLLKGSVTQNNKKSFLFKSNQSIKDTYNDQMNYFINCVNKGIIPENNIENSLKLVKYIL